MPPNDQEPRYRLVDANGNVVGSLFLNGNGDVAIQDESGTETAFTTDGISTPAVDADSVKTSELLTADIRSGGGDQIQINYIGSLADGGTTALSASDDTNGIVFVRTGNAAHAEISTRGGIEAVQIMSDPNSSFSTTQGNSGTYNVYYNSTAGRYELENQTGGSRGGIATWAFDAPF